MSVTNYMAYVAHEKCGCMTGATVDEPQYAKATAKDVADWIKDGRTVEHVSGDIVRKTFAVCPKNPAIRWNEPECKACAEH